MKRLALLAALWLFCAPVQAQSVDPAVTAVTQEWGVSEVSRGHLAEAIQKLVQAYASLQKHEADIAAYWKAYVAGLTPHPQ
jgi:hypothetical protein